MKVLEKTFSVAIIVGIFGVLIVNMPIQAQSQSGPTRMEESVEFNITGETYMSNSNDMGLMLDLVEKLQDNKYLEHISASSSQEIGSGVDSTAESSKISRFEIEAIYQFDSYEKFQSWYQSDEVKQYINTLQARLNRLNMNLNVAKRR